jgi:predicted phosphate transport protein (TIGR00153 family)
MKTTEKVPLQTLFNEDAELTEKALNSMSAAVSAFCQGKDKDMNSLIEETIKTEKSQDRIRDDIMLRLFGRETMVFSRTDRLRIVGKLDGIVDKAESIVRKLRMHKPEPIKELYEGINWLGTEAASIGQYLKELIIAVFEDFDKGKEIIIKIEDIRREVRNREYELLAKLYELKPEYADFIFLGDLINNLTSISNIIEEFSDEIYSLICKYTLG